MSQNVLEELLRKMASGIESPIVQARILKLIDHNDLSTPLTRHANETVAQELLNIVRGKGDPPAN